MVCIDKNGLASLLQELKARGYQLVGPTVSDCSIVYREIESLQDLPEDRSDEQHPGEYLLKVAEGSGLFGYAVGPGSLKQFLYPSKRQTSDGVRVGRNLELTAVLPRNGEREKSYAFIGVKSCELAALAVHDRVFMDGPYSDPFYQSVRERAFIVAANCLRPSDNCFCSSMNTGPRATSGFDLSLTELLSPAGHRFLVEVGSERGQEVLNTIPHEKAGNEEIGQAERALHESAENMTKVMQTEGVRELLNDNFDHPEWEKVAARCLACANCTMVCPTCFCSTMEEVTDLSGGNAERWRRWDSCFVMDFAKVASGNFRPSVKSRYRQWLTHKLAYWVDQFGTSGCVGCGRCITWCPVGIDITQEVDTIRTTSIKREPEYAH